MKTSTKALFLPGSPSHFMTLLPVARELRARGHSCSFLTRDSLIDPCYRIDHLIDRDEFGTHAYTGHYETDLDRFPGLSSYLRSRREIVRFLSSIEFDVAVVCNDDSGYFVRILIDHCRRQGKESLLVQEAVRPAYRNDAGTDSRVSLSAVARSALKSIARRSLSGPLFRKGYGHSPCTMIAAAGDRFRRQLVAEGVPEGKIRVTGQPRLDALLDLDSANRTARLAGEEAVLLFCHQPLPGTQTLSEELFRALISICETLGNVRLLFKLHPLDLPERHWLGLITDAERALVNVTQKRPLNECFQVADAMMTIASTTSLEALATGLPVGLINYLPIPWYLPFDKHGAVLSVNRREDLQGAVQSLLFDSKLRSALRENAPKVFLDELYLQDGQSAVRIADFVEERLGIVTPEVHVYEHART